MRLSEVRSRFLPIIRKRAQEFERRSATRPSTTPLKRAEKVRGQVERRRTKMKRTTLLWVLTAILLAPALTQARITRIEISRVEPVFDGVGFGHVGPYEKVVGRAFGEVDPDRPLNQGIVNIDKAPRNPGGRVEYIVDIYLLKPVNLRRGNQRIFYNVLNRGNKQALGFPNFNDAITANENEPTTLSDAGNGFLMRQGYVVLWSAWQGDVPAGGGRMLASLPVATDNGAPIVGVNRDEFIFDNPNPLNVGRSGPRIRHILAWGGSQSGRYLRDMLWQGFMEDENGRRVFDGIIPHKPGSRKTFTNFAFSQPGRFSRQHEDHLYGGDQFPFTYATRFDSISGRTDGLLARCLASSTCPKIMHTDTGTEPRGPRASLVVTDELGNDIPLPRNVRVYLFSSTQHGPALTPDFGICQQLSNPAPFGPALRALLVALDKWVSHGERPPSSRVPRVRNGTLVPSLPQSDQGFPEIPGVTYSGLVNELAELDTSVQPPTPIPDHDYVVLVPKVDADGHDLAGIRLPDIEAPLATHTGWNLRRTGFAEGEECSLTGSFVPLLKTRAERLEARSEER